MAGGFPAADGTVEFYGRVNALLNPSMTVLDFGAGRGAWLLDDPCAYRRQLRLLKHKVHEVVGIDLDPIVTTNAALDRALVLPPGEPLPVADASIDLIVSDFTFEHIEHPAFVGAELLRVLRPGGWICARTPNRWHYVPLLARLIPERLHHYVLKIVHPKRKKEDVFPAFYRMNTLTDLSMLFPSKCFTNACYRFSSHPAYVPKIPLIYSFVYWIDRSLPDPFRASIFIFLQKK